MRSTSCAWSPRRRRCPTSSSSPTTPPLPPRRSWPGRRCAAGPRRVTTTTTASRSRATRSSGRSMSRAAPSDLLSWVQADGLALATGTVSADRSSAAITDMYLEPGEHWFRIAGSGGEYTLHLTPLGPPDPAAEREPNDDEAHAEVLLVGAERNGRLPLAGDADIYRFSLAAAEHIRIGVEPPPDGAAAFRLSNGSTTLVEQRVPADRGGHLVRRGAAAGRLRHRPAPRGRQQRALPPLDRPAGPLRPGCRPGAQRRRRRWRVPSPPASRWTARARPRATYDWYRLPAVAAGETLVRALQRRRQRRAPQRRHGRHRATDDPESGTLTSEPLASDAPLFLSVRATGDYHLELSSPALVAVAPPASCRCTLVRGAGRPRRLRVRAGRASACRPRSRSPTRARSPWTWRSMPAPATTAGRWRSTRRT